MTRKDKEKLCRCCYETCHCLMTLNVNSPATSFFLLLLIWSELAYFCSYCTKQQGLAYTGKCVRFSCFTSKMQCSDQTFHVCQHLELKNILDLEISFLFYCFLSYLIIFSLFLFISGKFSVKSVPKIHSGSWYVSPLFAIFKFRHEHRLNFYIYYF